MEQESDADKRDAPLPAAWRSLLTQGRQARTVADYRPQVLELSMAITKGLHS